MFKETEINIGKFLENIYNQNLRTQTFNFRR